MFNINIGKGTIECSSLQEYKAALIENFENLNKATSRYRGYVISDYQYTDALNSQTAYINDGWVQSASYFDRRDGLNKYVGELFKTNNFGTVLVTDYVKEQLIRVWFINTGNFQTVSADQLRSGAIADRILMDSGNIPDSVSPMVR